MRRLIIAVAAALLACVASASALAAARDTGKPTDCKPRAYAFAGSASSIGTDSLIVEVDKTYSHDEGLGGERVNVRVNEATRIERDGKQIHLSDLVRGEHVAVVAGGCRGKGADQTFTAKLIRAGDRELSLGGSVVSVGSGSLTVEVDKTGPVSAAADVASLVGKQLTVAVTAATRITRDGKAIQLGDLVVGEHVQLRVHAVGSVYTAVWIRAGDRELSLGGSVVSVGSGSLTVEVDKTGPVSAAADVASLVGKQLTVAVTAATRITRDGKAIQLGDLVVGEHVLVRVHAVGSVYTAVWIRAGDHDIHVAGTISSVGASSVTLQVDRAGKNASDLDGKQVTVAVDQSTKILVNGQPAQLSDLKPGERAEVHAQGVAGHYTALEIRVRAPKPKPVKPAPATTTTTTSQR